MDDPARKFEEATASEHYLTAEDAGAVGDYLAKSGFLTAGENIDRVTLAGEGNMNLTLRVATPRRSFILKQSRPWVAKFPQLDAPVERILIEHRFAEKTSESPAITDRMPTVLKADPANFTLILEDLGTVGDLSSVYADGRSLTSAQLRSLLKYAAAVHQIEATDFPPNRELKALNHAHVFDLPLRADSGFPLDELHPGLAEVARPYHHDEALRRVVTDLGELYLSTGTRLIHGDFYPGSFLDVHGKVYVIDAEFAHAGRPEFDIGVLMAHLIMARAPEALLKQIDTDYGKPAGFDAQLARRFCYVEIIRRLIGIAQLPLSLSLDERAALLERARAGLA